MRGWRRSRRDPMSDSAIAAVEQVIADRQLPINKRDRWAEALAEEGRRAGGPLIHGIPATHGLARHERADRSDPRTRVGPRVGRPSARWRTCGRAGEAICTARVSEAELRVGPHRSPDPVAELLRTERVLAGCTILEFDATAARIFAEVKAHLLNIGRPVGDMDVQIAAVALAGSQPLVTRNARHFADVPGLRVESY